MIIYIYMIAVYIYIYILRDGSMMYPSGKPTELWKITSLHRKTHVIKLWSWLRKLQQSLPGWVSPIKSHSTTIFPWFFYGFPMVFPWFSYGFSMVSRLAIPPSPHHRRGPGPSGPGPAPAGPRRTARPGASRARRRRGEGGQHRELQRHREKWRPQIGDGF